MLERGGTVVVPSRQRAVAVRLEHTRAQLRARRRAWGSCNVLSFSAWLAQLAAQARHGPLRGLRRLGSAEEWCLWRAAAEQACEGTGTLQPASLAEALRKSAALCRDWALRWPGDPTPEAMVLTRARRWVERRCAELKAYRADDWNAVLRDAPPLPRPLLFAGCDGLGPALRERLVELGAEFLAGDDAAHAPEELRPCANATDELRRAAQWCRAGLGRNPAARFLIVVPELAQWRAAAVMAFEHELCGGDMPAAADELPFVIEGGRALSEYPLVDAALGVLQLAGGALEFRVLAPLLRSPYFGCGSLAQRAALELALRDRNVHAADLARLAGLARNLGRDAGHSLADALEAVAARLQPSRGARATPAEWARRFAEALDASGWPGSAALGSDEQQQQTRLRELLGELAMLGAGAGSQLDHAAALELLVVMARRTAFEAASEDAPVTLTDSLDDPLVSYDGIWVAGLSAELWPVPPRPDPFIPMAVQRASGLPAASAQGQLESSERALRGWRRSAGSLVLSWPESDGDVVLSPSSLVAPMRPHEPARAAPPALVDPLYSGLARSSAREPRVMQAALGWNRERPLPRGTRTLELESLCPFRASAELRLGAAPVAEPVPGLDRRDRGLILHHALQQIWEELRDSRTLRARAAQAEGLTPLVHGAAEGALHARLALRAQPLPAPLVDNELWRLTALIDQLLQQELQRSGAAEFRVEQLEQSSEGTLAGVPLRVRMDRLDCLDDGRLIVIDYKSGAGESFQPLAERPRQPQLLAYALLAAGEVAGVASVHLRAGEVTWRGAVAEPALLPPLKSARGATAPWTVMLAHWRVVIDRLVSQFVAGDIAVDPRAGACDLCHLPALCRIDATRQRAEDSLATESETGGSSDA